MKAWIEKNIEVEVAGLIVDVHTVLEYIFFSMLYKNFLESFMRIHKLHISTLAQGLAMTSYEKPIAKFLSSGVVRVVRNNESYFDRWKTWEDYDHPETGFRSVIKRELEDVLERNRQQVEDRLETETSAHMLATLSTTTSVSIADNIFLFIDNFVR